MCIRYKCESCGFVFTSLVSINKHSGCKKLQRQQFRCLPCETVTFAKVTIHLFLVHHHFYPFKDKNQCLFLHSLLVFSLFFILFVFILLLETTERKWERGFRVFVSVELYPLEFSGLPFAYLKPGSQDHFAELQTSRFRS